MSAWVALGSMQSLFRRIDQFSTIANGWKHAESQLLRGALA